MFNAVEDNAVEDGIKIRFDNPQFITSVGGNPAPQELRYMVFAGRSNAGKSSVINALCGGRFARVAKVPGRTRLINLFRINGSASNIALADLPGYGYASVAREQKREWEFRLTRFLLTADICCLVTVVDCRRGIGELDQRLFDLYAPRRLPMLILLNKADKLTRQACGAVYEKTVGQINTPVLLFSALKKTGISPLQEYLKHCICDGK